MPDKHGNPTLSEMHEAAQWAVDVLEPLVSSLTHQGKMPEDARGRVDELKAIVRFFEFVRKDDVEIRRKF